MAYSSGRNYANLEKLGAQYDMLKCRFEETSAVDSLQKWTMFFHKENLYSDIPDIMHLALCRFVKIPLEATAETTGSVINNHGCKTEAACSPKDCLMKCMSPGMALQSSVISQRHSLRNPWTTILRRVKQDKTRLNEQHYMRFHEKTFKDPV